MDLPKDTTNPWLVTYLEEFLYYCCPECDERCQSRDTFLDHALGRHPLAEDSLKKFQINDFDNDNFLNITDIKQENYDHEESSVSEAMMMEIPVDPPLKEESEPLKKPIRKCAKKKKTSTTSINKSKKCEICCKVYANRDSWRAHMRNEHPKDNSKVWACQQCDFMGKHERSLKAHMSTVHQKEKLAKMFCSHCGKEDVSIGNLKGICLCGSYSNFYFSKLIFSVEMFSFCNPEHFEMKI